MTKPVTLQFEGRQVTCTHIVHSKHGAHFFGCGRIANKHAELTRGTVYPAAHVARVSDGYVYLYMFKTQVMQAGADPIYQALRDAGFEEHDIERKIGEGYTLRQLKEEAIADGWDV